MSSEPFEVTLDDGRLIVEQPPDMWALLLHNAVPSPIVGTVSWLIEQTKRSLNLPPPDLTSEAAATWFETQAWIVMNAAVKPQIVDSVAAGQALVATGVPVAEVTFIGSYTTDQLHYLAMCALAGHARLPFPQHVPDEQSSEPALVGVGDDAERRTDTEPVAAA